MEVGVHAQLSRDAGDGGVLPQAGCYLSVGFDHKQAKVAAAVLEHEVVYLPYHFGGGTEREPRVGEPRIGEFSLDTVPLAIFLGLGIGDVGVYGSALGGVGRVHFLIVFKTKLYGVGLFYLL